MKLVHVTSMLPLALSPIVMLSVASGQQTEVNPKSGGFIRWLRQNGATVSDNIKVSKDPAKGRMIKATGSIKAGETLMTVPKTLALSLDTVSDECRRYAEAVVSATEAEMGEDGLTSALGKGGDASFRLAFALLYEAGRSAESPWHLYILSLPKVVGSAKMRPKLELSIVIGEDLLTGAFNAASRAAEEVRSRFIASSHGSQTPKLDGQQIRWAWDTVKSRAMRIDGLDRIVPGVDLVNHDDQATAETSFGSSGEMILTATADLRIRQEVSVNYVKSFNIHQPCYQWLFDYGFVPGKDLMPSYIEGIRVDLPPPSEEDPEAPYNARAREWLAEHNCGEPHTLYATGEIPPRLFACVRALTVAIHERHFRYGNKDRMQDDELILAAKAVQAMKHPDTDVSVPLIDGNVEQQAFIELRRVAEHLMEGKKDPARDDFDSLDQQRWVYQCHTQQNRLISHISDLCTQGVWAIELPNLRKRKK
eukprot:gnl/MRDRNA2_/MRDRNA2_35942_c0_seq1.p1 gnl/MRDRNA2_/MRDRNA2_35942_c0~~gnl/MRDRNA2_/MRDRNA2_35942_c0_seq1.p1  ORF type:complete len:478 (+),score=87.96 gnl/MRDRNA2_/MRDRNA2_35942_c0_seq1:64-1497(+)